MALQWMQTIARWAVLVFVVVWAVLYIAGMASEGVARVLCALTFRGGSEDCVERMKRRIEAWVGNLDAILGALTLGFLSVKGFKFLRRGETRAGISSDTDRAPAAANEHESARPREGRGLPRPSDAMRR